MAPAGCAHNQAKFSPLDYTIQRVDRFYPEYLGALIPSAVVDYVTNFANRDYFYAWIRDV